MNYRAARRLATIRLAQAAQDLAKATSEQMSLADGLTLASKERLVRAFQDLSHEMAKRAGVVPRTPRPAPVDPLQQVLFETDRSGGDRHG